MKKIILTAITIGLASLSFAQTINIGPDQYAFRYTVDDDYGLFFSLTNTQYELRNSVPVPVWAVDANDGRYNSNIRFNPGADLMIDGDRYAFRYTAAPNYGLFFSLSDSRYEFRTVDASPVFQIEANTGEIASAGDANVNEVTVGKGGGNVSTNTAIGKSALANNTIGSNNTAIGANTLLNINEQTDLTAVGTNALMNNGIGALPWEATGNTAVGSNVLKSNTMGGNHTAVGANALTANTTGSANISIGTNSLYINTIGSYNVAIGPTTLRNNIDGNNNCAIGYQTMYNSEGNNNMASGYRALYNNTTGSSNTAVGFQGLLGNTTGSLNTVLGYLANVSTGGLSNATAIGANSYVSANNSLILGSIDGVNGATATSKVGIGISAPVEELQINQSFPGILLTNPSSGTTINDGLRIAVGAANWASINNQENGKLFLGVNKVDIVQLHSNGNVGIGISNSATPSEKLHINGYIRFDDDGDGIKFSNASGITAPMITMFQSGSSNANRMVFAHSSSNNNTGLQFRDVDDSWHFLEGGSTRVSLGSELIGDGYYMTVEGKILCDELKVQDPGAWPDYVFNDDYELPTLEEVQKHINDNKHLPGVPSAAEVSEDGLSMGEISVKLMQKIEELMLYTLQQQEEIREVKELYKQCSGSE